MGEEVIEKYKLDSYSFWVNIYLDKISQILLQ